MEKLMLAMQNTDSVDSFMHGFDHILVLQIFKELDWKPIVITDVEYVEGTEIETHVIRHAGSIKPNGQIVDAENIYENKEEFLEYVEENYPELEGFILLEGEKALEILMKYNNELSIKNLNPTDKKYLMDFIQFNKNSL